MKAWPPKDSNQDIGGLRYPLTSKKFYPFIELVEANEMFSMSNTGKTKNRKMICHCFGNACHVMPYCYKL